MESSGSQWWKIRSTPPILQAPDWSVHGTGLVSVILYLTLVSFSWQSGGIAVWQQLLILTLAWLVFGWMGWRSSSVGLGAILIWGVSFRLAGLGSAPLLEDDHFRYLWDGWVFLQTGNPYAQAPIESFGKHLPAVMEVVLDGINHPDLKTVYGPCLQFCFALGALIATGQLWILQLIWISMDVISALILFRIGGWRAALHFFWCPLAVKEIGFSAHPESLGILLIVAALLTLRERAGSSGFLTGLACSTRVFALLVAPLFFWRSENRVTWTVFFLLGVFSPYLVFWVIGAWDLTGAWGALGNSWEFNSFLFAPLNWIFGRPLALLLCGFLWLLGAGLILKFSERDSWPGDWLILSFFLVSPVVNPWYLLWALPFVALRPSGIGWGAMVGVMLAYLTFGNLGWEGPLHGHPWWVRPLELGCVVVGGLMERWLKRHEQP